MLANCLKIDFKQFCWRTFRFSGQAFIIVGSQKSSVEKSIPIIPVGTLFHVQTCADAEIRRHARAENKWICWHRRLGYMPLATIQQMINTCQGLEDLQGIAMPRNYISANVR